MPRIARTVAPGYPHHVTQRGNYQQSVFDDEDDFCQYLKWLQEYSKKHNRDPIECISEAVNAYLDEKESQIISNEERQNE